MRREIPDPLAKCICRGPRCHASILLVDSGGHKCSGCDGRTDCRRSLRSCSYCLVTTRRCGAQKHVSVIGFDRLNHYTTILRGQLTCDLTLEGGSAKTPSRVGQGIAVMPPSSKTAATYFTGSSSQKLILTDTAIEGSVPAPPADNTFTAGTGTSQVLITDCRLCCTSVAKPALRVKSGSIEAVRTDIWNRPQPESLLRPP